MKLATLTTVLVIVAGLSTSLTLAATDSALGPGAMGMEEGNIAQMLLGRMGEQLNLTEEQKTSIRQIAQESRSDMQEGRNEVRMALQKLNEAADTGDQAAVDEAGKAAGEALAKQAKQRAEVAKKVNEVLTEEQRTKLDEMKANMKQQMEQRMGQRREQRISGQDTQAY